MTVNKKIIETMQAPVISYTTKGIDGTEKTRNVQRLLKSTDFDNRNSWTLYNGVINLFIRAAAAFLDSENGGKDVDKVTKSDMLKDLQGVANALKYEGIAIKGADGKKCAVPMKNYHVNFIIGHARQLKINADKTIADIMRSETAIRKTIELVISCAFTGAALPGVVLSEKSKERMAKNSQRVADIIATAENTKDKVA